MSKKVIIIIVATIIAVAIVIGGIVSVPKVFDQSPDKGSQNDEGSQIDESYQIPELGDGKEFFKVTAIEEVAPLVEKYNFQLAGPEYETGFISVYDAKCCGLPVQFDFFPYEDRMEWLQNMICYFIPFSAEYKDLEAPTFTHNGKELREEVTKFFEMLENVYSVTIDDNYFIISSADGSLLSNTENASFDKIIAKEAFIDFSLRDERGYYWNLKSSMTDEGLVYLKFTNYYDDMRYYDNIVHVTVE